LIFGGTVRVLITKQFIIGIPVSLDNSRLAPKNEPKCAPNFGAKVSFLGAEIGPFLGAKTGAILGAKMRPPKIDQKLSPKLYVQIKEN
jgi:hypothetical protein